MTLYDVCVSTFFSLPRTELQSARSAVQRSARLTETTAAVAGIVPVSLRSRGHTVLLAL